MRYQRSSRLFKEAKEVIPGGVNSPVRAFKAVGGNPVFIKKAKGAYLFDEDNNKYIDYISSWGPMILGHAHPKVTESIIKTTKNGTSFGTPTELETKIAKLAIKMVPNIDQIRFVNSGTEACMSAIRLARGFTGKEKIIKFSGCYHGHSDSFLIQAGSGGATFGNPSSPGVTQGSAKDTLIAEYNNIDNVSDIFDKNKNEIAALIIEPVAGNMGCIPPKKDFLKGLRSLCDDHKALLIFDEVMTGFRLSKGGAQELYGIKADIVTFGKVLGGGLPVGAFASNVEIMSFLAPKGEVYQAGTLSGNPLAMIAGYNTLKILDEDPEIYSRLEKKTKKLEEQLRYISIKNKIKHQINRIGSMISIHFTDHPVVNFETSKKGDNIYYKKYFHGMLDQNIYLPPSAYESYFLNDAISDKDIDLTSEAYNLVSLDF